MLYLALLIGIVAGSRAMMAPVVVTWAARRHGLQLEDTWLSILGWRFTPWIFTLASLGELVTDQLPSTPSRKVPVQFAVRIIMGALCGAAIGVSASSLIGGLVLGVVGAVIGTLGGAALRSKMAAAFKNDHPAAIIEDVIAIALSIAVYVSL